MKKKLLWSIMAFAIPLLICVLICIIKGVYPFGDTCVLHMDMYHQYYPFYQEFLDKLQTGGSLQYSWDLGLGSDFTSLYAYYLASPLNILLLFWPEKYLIEFMTLSIIIKIAVSGLGFFLFLKYHFQIEEKTEEEQRKALYTALVFSSAYALSGFVAAYSWNIMWMDCIALAPFVLLGVEKLVKEKKVALYYVTLAIAIFSNYYIAILLCVFTVFFFVLQLFETKKDILKTTGRFALYSALAGGTAAILILPEIAVLGYTASSGSSFPEQIEWYFNILEEITRTAAMATPYVSSEHWPNLYAGSLSLFLIVLYILNKDISWKRKLPRLGMLVFFILSFANNILDFMWHGFHFPVSLPGRQSFLYVFLVLCIAYEAMLHLDKSKIWHIVTAFVVWAIVFTLAYVIFDESVTEAYALFVTVGLIAVYALLTIMQKIGFPKIRPYIPITICVVMLIELFFNMHITGIDVTSRSAYVSKTEAYEELLEKAEENTTGFYRVEDTQRKCKNDSAYYGYPSATIFSSLMNINVSHFYQRLFMEGGQNYYCYNGATPTVSSMLSVKYMLSDSKLEESPLRRCVAECDGQYLYENRYTLPLGFVMSQEACEAWDMETNSKVNNLNNLGYALGCDEKMIGLVPVESDVQPGKTLIYIEQSGYYYAQSVDCTSSKLRVSSSDGRKKTFSKTTHRYLLDLGYYRAGDIIAIENQNNTNIDYKVGMLNASVVEQSFDELSKQTMVLDEKEDTYIKGHIQMTEAGKLIFSIPDEEGWTIYVNGKEVESDTFKDTFVAVDLEPGEYEIELKYETPNLKVGAVISFCCIAIFSALQIIKRMLAKKQRVVADE